jgi:hypothetical protein
MSQITVRGAVRSAGGEFPVASVFVTAVFLSEDARALGKDDAPGTLSIAQGLTDSQGVFNLEGDGADEALAPLVCALRCCSSVRFRLVCRDRDGAVLHESEALSYEPQSDIAIELSAPDIAQEELPLEQLGARMLDAQIARVGEVARELATLSPRGVFRDWSVRQRLGVMGALEQAVLDPRGAFAERGLTLSFAALREPHFVRQVEARLQQEKRSALRRGFDSVAARVHDLHGLDDVGSMLDPHRISAGDIVGAVDHGLKLGVHLGDFLPWFKSPLVGYRDYLRDSWVESQRSGQVTWATIVARLFNRFHQDFETQDTAMQPAAKILIPILGAILRAPTGDGYGFGVAAGAIAAQGDMDDQAYIDYLVSLSGISRAEMGKRYRLSLDRSFFDHSSPVQQNVDTLQRFFTDSHQSVADPFPINPDRVVGKAENLITAFPPEAAGPFFLEYEEWLARERPFYPENFYDPRATIGWRIVNYGTTKTRDLIFANSMPIGDFVGLQPGQLFKFTPHQDGPNPAAVKWQWVRNHVELWDLIMSAHADAASLNCAGAQQKYGLALAWSTKLRELAGPDAIWHYNPSTFVNEQRKADVSSIEKLSQYEPHTITIGYHWDSEQSTSLSDLHAGDTEIIDNWWGSDSDQGHRRALRYLLDYLTFRLLPACLSEMELALGNYADAVRLLIGPAQFNIFAAAPNVDPYADGGGTMHHFTEGPLAYASSSNLSKVQPPPVPTMVPSNKAEIGWFKLKLGNTTLEWADALYRSNRPESIMRARELYKAVLFLHGDDPEISPSWPQHLADPYPFGLPQLLFTRNPAVDSQCDRARLGFMQVNDGRNYYGVPATHVPPVRYRVLKEAADRFAAGARGAQMDFQSYMQQLDELTFSEMTARTMVTKADAAIGIAQEQQKIAEFNVGEAQKQVAAINAQIAAKKAEIAKADDFFEQVKDFASGMKASVSKLADIAFSGEGDATAASAQKLSTGDILSFGFKVGTASSVLGGATSALAAASGVAGPFGAFLYAGVSSMQSMADAIAKRAGELAQLENVALPAAKALVTLKQRDVTIAQLSQAIAKADWQLGSDLLLYFSQRFRNRAFLISMAEFSNRLMRRYLDLAGRMAWFAERALAFEQDRELNIIAFDYFPRNLHGVSGADLLQLHLAELEAARIQGLTQTIPVKQTISLARDFPLEFGQLKKTGACRFATREAPLQLVYPGIFGYRIRNLTVAAAYAAAVRPHRGLLSNLGVSMVTREAAGSAHQLLRFPDALPLSEFRMHDDMWVFDLPDETLLPFEGSGFETIWELKLPKQGNATGLEAMTDVFLTFDMRASYSAALEQAQLASLPNSSARSLLMSANAGNPGVLAKFRKDGGAAHVQFDLAAAAFNPNETSHTLTNLVLIAVGLDAPFDAEFRSASPAQVQAIGFDEGLAASNDGVLAGGNGGTPLPLNTFAGMDADQIFTLKLDEAANPGVDVRQIRDLLLLADYKVAF